MSLNRLKVAPMSPDELKRRLCEGEGFAQPSFLIYPMTPRDASALIVQELLDDLSEERRGIVRDVICEWAGAREGAVTVTVAESSYR